MHLQPRKKTWAIGLAVAVMLALAAWTVPVLAAVDSATSATITSRQAALDYYLELVECLEVTTAVNKTVFYSGQTNRSAAEEFALAEDKTTLEMTPGGKFLDELKLFAPGSPLTQEEAKRVWSRLSQRYAAQAAGNVFCFVADARPTGVFTTVELPELKHNRKISGIYYVTRL